MDHRQSPRAQRWTALVARGHAAGVIVAVRLEGDMVPEQDGVGHVFSPSADQFR
jgi:hypothetical protein